MSSENASAVLGVHEMKILGGRSPGETTGDGEFEIAN